MRCSARDGDAQLVASEFVTLLANPMERHSGAGTSIVGASALGGRDGPPTSPNRLADRPHVWTTTRHSGLVVWPSWMPIRPDRPKTRKRPYAAMGLKLRSKADSAMPRRKEPVTTARHTARNANGPKCLAEYLSKPRYQ